MNEEKLTQETINNFKDIEDFKPLLEDYLRANYGLKNIKTPIKCINPNHNDTHPSMYFNKRNNTLHCFACGETYDLIDLIKQEQGLNTIREALAFLKNYYNGQPLPQDYKKGTTATPNGLKDFTGLINTLEDRETEKDKELKLTYLQKRGFNSEIAQNLIKAFSLKILTTKEGEKTLFIPHRHFIEERLIYTDYQSRTISEEADKKDRYRRPQGVSTSLYDPSHNLDLPYTIEGNFSPIILVEGEIDSLSVYACLLEAVKQYSDIARYTSIALSGTQNDKAFINCLKAKTEAERQKYKIILCLDNDQAGEQATSYLKEELKKLDVFFYESHITKDLKAKDFNEAYINDKETLIKDLNNLVQNLDTIKAEEEELNKKQEQEAYINSYSVYNHLSDFKKRIKESETLKPTITGFNDLDNKLFNGGIPKGLLTIGAISSLGKTTLILQIADQIAQTRQADILYFSLEMSRNELIAKSVSRLSFLNGSHQNKRAESSTALDVIQGNKYKYFTEAKKDLIEQSINDYTTFARNLYIIESVASEGLGTKEIEAQIKEHIAKTGKKPIVIIDYLQIMKSPDTHLNDKQAIDRNISTLKRISAEYSLLIIAISSLSRANYTSEVDIASFKESGAIEYTSDILIGLDLYALSHLAESEDFKDTSNEGKNIRKIKQIIKEAKEENPRHINLTILKNRNGKTGASASFYYYPAYNCFMEEHGNGEELYNILETSRKAYNEEESELLQDLPF